MPNVLGSAVKVKASPASLERVGGALLGLRGGGHWTLKRNGTHRPGPVNSERLVSPSAMTEVGGQWPCLTQNHEAFGPDLQGTSDEAGRRTPSDPMNRTFQSSDQLEQFQRGTETPRPLLSNRGRLRLQKARAFSSSSFYPPLLLLTIRTPGVHFQLCDPGQVNSPVLTVSSPLNCRALSRRRRL